MRIIDFILLDSIFYCLLNYFPLLRIYHFVIIEKTCKMIYTFIVVKYLTTIDNVNNLIMNKRINMIGDGNMR